MGGELKAQNIFESVVIASESDFGRTLSSNGAGTDHAWAGNHFVIGGNVNGGRVYNDFPSSLLDGNDQDLGRGRLLPKYLGKHDGPNRRVDGSPGESTFNRVSKSCELRPHSACIGQGCALQVFMIVFSIMHLNTFSGRSHIFDPPDWEIFTCQGHRGLNCFFMLSTCGSFYHPFVTPVLR